MVVNLELIFFSNIDNTDPDRFHPVPYVLFPKPEKPESQIACAFREQIKKKIIAAKIQPI